jgi:hypothetical protein
VQLVEHQKAQTLRCTHELAILGTREQQLEHHVVGEQDVRWIGEGVVYVDGVREKRGNAKVAA